MATATSSSRNAPNGSHRANTVHSHTPADSNGNGKRRKGMISSCVSLIPQVEQMLEGLQNLLDTDRHGVVLQMATALNHNKVTREEIRTYAKAMNSQFILAQWEERNKLKSSSSSVVKLDNPKFQWKQMRFDWDKGTDLTFKKAARDTFKDDTTTDYNRSKILSILIVLFAVKYKVARLEWQPMRIDKPTFVMNS